MTSNLLIALLFLIGVAFSAAFYSSRDDVQELTGDSFNQLTSSDGVWIVEFYAPWCGHCKSLASTWKKVAGHLKGIVNVRFGKILCVSSPQICFLLGCCCGCYNRGRISTKVWYYRVPRHQGVWP